MIKGEPTWIGSGTAAVLAWIHTPTNATSRAIVVVAPPAGRELMLSTLTVRRLCIVLAQAGYTAVRFGWRGSLDSQPLDGSQNAVQAWQEDLRSVVAGTRELLGSPDLPTYGVGYRTGAAVLGSLLEDFDAVVSWEPQTGRSFVRQWTRLRQTVAAHVPPTEGLVDLLGMALTPEQTEQFAALGTPVPTHPEEPVSSGEQGDVVPGVSCAVTEVKEANKRRSKAMYAVEPFDTRLHEDVFDMVCAALPESPQQPVAAELSTVLENSWSDAQGNLLRERLVEIGADHRVGVVTWKADMGEPGNFHATAISAETSAEETSGSAESREVHGLLVSGGGPDGRVGSGEWPLIARALASDGIVTLRVDRPLVGDATPVDAVRATNSYTGRSANSFTEATDWLRANGCTRISAGLLCSSAWAASLGEVHGAPVQASTILLIGHSEWKMSEDLWAQVRETFNADAPPDTAPTNRAARSGPARQLPPREFRAGIRGVMDRLAWAGEVVRSGGLETVKSLARDQVVLTVRTRMPYALWRFSGAVGLLETPERVLAPMSARARVVVLNGPDDLPRWHKTRADRAVQRLSAAGHQITSVESDRLDHSVITATGCRTVLENLRENLVQPATGGAHPVGSTHHG